MKTSIFKQDAKSVVDMTFNTKLFREDITRDDMNELEGYIFYLLESRYDSYIRGIKLLEKVKKVNCDPDHKEM